MVTVSAMVILLMAMYIVNNMLSSTWDYQKQGLEASSAANQMALAINRAVAGGNGTQIKFNNHVGASVVNVTINPPRTVSANTTDGLWSSTPIITNSTSASGPLPINREVVVRNVDGVIFVAEG
jgi:hypothetical protein